MPFGALTVILFSSTSSWTSSTLETDLKGLLRSLIGDSSSEKFGKKLLNVVGESSLSTLLDRSSSAGKRYD